MGIGMVNYDYEWNFDTDPRLGINIADTLEKMNVFFSYKF